MFEHVMVDLETLGREPGSIIASIGAVKFDTEGETLGLEFYANIDVQSCVDIGLTIGGETFRWWMDQPEEARRALFSPTPMPLRDVLSAFAEFYKGSEFIWSHGSTFDTVILDAAYRALKMGRPWLSKNTRDTRTLFDLVSQSVLDTVPSPGPSHHGLFDAIRQARMVQEAYRWLRREPCTTAMVSKG